MFNLLNYFREWNYNRNIPEHTPDYHELNDAPGWPVFEYGEFKSSLPLHKKLGIEPRGQAFTVQKLPLWGHNKGVGSFPVALDFHLPEVNNGPRGCIAGELYLIPTQKIPFLDTHRENGVKFDRKLVSVNLLDGSTIRAFMYKGRRELWTPWIEWDHDFYKGRNGSAFSFIHPQRKSVNSNEFYSNFTPNDLREGSTKCFLHVSDRPIPADKQAA